MFGVVMLIAAVGLMARIAEEEGRSPIIWGGITFGMCVLCGNMIRYPFIDIGVGFVLSFGMMFLAKVIRD